MGKEITVITLGTKMFLKIGTPRIMGGKCLVSSVLGWLGGRAGEVKHSLVCASSVLTKRGTSEALSWVRPPLCKQRPELSHRGLVSGVWGRHDQPIQPMYAFYITIHLS